MPKKYRPARTRITGQDQAEPAFPVSARHGLHRWQLDASWWVIRGLEKVGLVWNVKVPDAAQRDRRRVQPI